MSTAIRRASTKLRGGKPDDEPVKEMTDKDIEKSAKALAGSRAEKDFLKDQMTYQRDANAMQASATSIQDNAENVAKGQIQKANFDGLPEAQANGDYKDPVE